MRTPALFILVLGLVALPAAILAQDAENPCAGKGAVNPCGEKAANPCGAKASNPCAGKKPHLAPDRRQAKHGTVFAIDDSKGRDSVSFSSSAPLEDIVGTTSEIHGYLIFDPKNPKNGVRGDLRVSVASLNTGIPLRDEHLRGPSWLDAEKFPEIRYRIDGTNGVKLLKEGDGFRTFEMKLSGIMTLHGQSRRLYATARVTYLPESERTRTRLPGDLLAGRAKFKVPLKHFGIKGFEGVVGSKVSEEIEISVGIMGSSRKAAAEPAMNPCAKTAANPCAGKAASPKAR